MEFQGQNSMDEEFELLEIEDEDVLSLSHWEFIDASDVDSDEPHRHRHRHRHGESDSEQQRVDKDEDEDEDEANGSDDGSVASASPPVTDPVRPHRADLVRVIDLGLNFKPRHDPDGGDEDESDEDDVYGLDDELVPWSVSDKVGRQRMRKLGKRTFPKLNNSKRSPYLVVRPGCVRGKHGLGLKHIY